MKSSTNRRKILFWAIKGAINRRKHCSESSQSEERKGRQRHEISATKKPTAAVHEEKLKIIKM